MSLAETVTLLALPDAAVRAQAEARLENQAQEHPGVLARGLVALVGSPAGVGALLHLKRLVPRFWSGAFELFQGPAIDVESKVAVREALINATASETVPERATAAYAIVQIAVADFPDEWPDLLEVLYRRMHGDAASALGAIAVLRDLFDDLVSEELFFEGGVGAAVIRHALGLLAATATPTSTKAEAAKLYRACLRQLVGVEAQATAERRAAVAAHLPEVVLLCRTLVAENVGNGEALALRLQLYQIATTLANEFRGAWAGQDAEMVAAAVADASTIAGQLDSELAEATLSECLAYIGASRAVPPQLFPQLAFALLAALLLLAETREEYLADPNAYVTAVSGLSAGFTPRDAVEEMLAESDASLVSAVAEVATAALGESPEPALHVVSACIATGELESVPESLRSQLESLVTSSDPLVAAGAVQLFPRLVLLGDSPGPYLQLLFAAATTPLVQTLLMVALLLYASESVLPAEVQGPALALAWTLLDDADDDTSAVLLEATTHAIAADPAAAVASDNALRFVLAVATRNALNIQVVIDARDALGALLEAASPSAYSDICNTALPQLVPPVEAAVAGGSVEYSPELALALELLLQFVTKAAGGAVPSEVFAYVFPAVCRLLLAPCDDQILQTGAETFTAFLSHTAPLVAEHMDTVLQVVARFLDPATSDSAALHAGNMVAALVEHVQLGSNLPAVLHAATTRLVLARETVTIENLVMVFCRLVNLSPRETVEFLATTPVTTETGEVPALQAVLPIWFAAFEVARGFERIRDSVLALGTLYGLADARVAAVEVDGDIIPYEGDEIMTRLKARARPPQYTRVLAPLKIVKLLVLELEFQRQQPDAVEAGDDDDEWEDVQPSLAALQQYAEADREADGSIATLIAQFFRGCARNDTGGFSQLYQHLSDHERSVLAEEV